MRRRKKERREQDRVYLVAFDMDGTLIPIDSSWSFIHRILGTQEIASRYRRMYEEGKISYRRWAELDVSTWKDKDFTSVLSMIENLDLMEHAREAISSLRRGDFIVGLISSGIDVVAKKVCEELNMDFCRSATLKIVDNKVIGIEKELAPELKGMILKSIARSYDIPLHRVAFVGDGDSDLSVFQMNIGMKIAFRAKSEQIIRLADYHVEDLLEAAKILLKWKGSK